MPNEIINNILTQFILFPVIVFIGSWIGFEYVFKNSDWKKTNDALEEAEYEGDERKIKKLERRMKLIDVQFWLQDVIDVLRSWTIDLVINVIILIFAFITGILKKVKIKICDRNDSEEGIDGESCSRGELYFNIKARDEDFPIRCLIFFPILAFGTGILNIALKFLPMLLGFELIRWLLPATFDSVIQGLEKWFALINTPFSLGLFTNIKDIFIDILWNRLIIGGINENIGMFIVVSLYFIIFTSYTYSNMFETDGKMVSSRWSNFMYTTIFVIAFNMVVGMMFPLSYAQISNEINSIGMMCAFFLGIEVVIHTINWAPMFLIKKLTDKLLDKVKSAVKIK